MSKPETSQRQGPDATAPRSEPAEYQSAASWLQYTALGASVGMMWGGARGFAAPSPKEHVTARALYHAKVASFSRSALRYGGASGICVGLYIGVREAAREHLALSGLEAGALAGAATGALTFIRAPMRVSVPVTLIGAIAGAALTSSERAFDDLVQRQVEQDAEKNAAIEDEAKARNESEHSELQKNISTLLGQLEESRAALRSAMEEKKQEKRSSEE